MNQRTIVPTFGGLANIDPKPRTFEISKSENEVLNFQSKALSCNIEDI
jgi:hypothetical protein